MLKGKQEVLIVFKDTLGYHEEVFKPIEGFCPYCGCPEVYGCEEIARNVCIYCGHYFESFSEFSNESVCVASQLRKALGVSKTLFEFKDA
jgi:hypothetical protein